jgi:hypothetical protein
MKSDPTRLLSVSRAAMGTFKDPAPGERIVGESAGVPLGMRRRRIYTPPWPGCSMERLHGREEKPIVSSWRLLGGPCVTHAADLDEPRCKYVHPRTCQLDTGSGTLHVCKCPGAHL